MKRTLGGDRLGAGKKMKVDLHGYGRSTHDLSYVFRSTMAAGTLVPFLKKVALPGDTFDIDLAILVNTHPTIGPLFGSYKVQLDIFEAPMRLYNAQLHNNKLNIGMDMSKVKFPIIQLLARPNYDATDLDNCQVNPSCLLSYLGIRGIGSTDADQNRNFNCMPILAYWDIYKQYYANKQEEIGAVIHKEQPAIVNTIDTVKINATVLPLAPTVTPNFVTGFVPVEITYTGTQPILSQVIFNTSAGELLASDCLMNVNTSVAGTITATYNFSLFGARSFLNYRMATADDLPEGTISVTTFPLTNIDTMRENILGQGTGVPFILNDHDITPYIWLPDSPNDIPNSLNSQEGLGVKTYLSDLYNNWLNTEWIDGVDGISQVTSIDTSGGSFTIDTLNLSKKVYLMLNRIMVSGGSYQDWVTTVYDHEGFWMAESPIYHGGLIKELIFQEIISNAEVVSDNGTQPLGTLAGKGVLGSKHKGGKITIKVNEPSYIMGIASFTPRIDYSQGNDWDMWLETMDDLHKPQLDEVGFEDLITEGMAWWSTKYNAVAGAWEQRSAGKQPAWINYMTSVNRTYGNFAIETNEMFMTLNRRFTPDDGTSREIGDLTTYIDPSKYNFIFAQTSLDSQNFWVQIGVDLQVRRVMSAKVMPNL